MNPEKKINKGSIRIATEYEKRTNNNHHPNGKCKLFTHISTARLKAKEDITQSIT